jgi:hypothetical protein
VVLPIRVEFSRLKAQAGREKKKERVWRVKEKEKVPKQGKKRPKLTYT